MKKRMTSALLIAGAIGASLMFSGCAPKTFEEKINWGEEKASDYLDLSEQQEPLLESIANTVKSRHPEFKAIRLKLASVIKTEIEKDQFDINVVLNETQKLQQYLDNTSAELISELSDFHDALSPEQRGKIRDLTDKNRPHRWHPKRDWDDSRPQIRKNFNLQPDQAAAAKNLFSGIAVDSVDLMIARNNLRQTIKDQLAKDKFDSIQMKSAINNILSLFFNSVRNRLPEFANLHATMTKEQKMILVDAVDQMIKRQELLD